MTAGRFRPGQSVRVKALFPPGHCRTPFYVRGRRGTVLDRVDEEPNPEERAYGRPGLPALPVWRVAFAHGELWPDDAGPEQDRVVVGIFEPWLEPVEEPA